MSKDIQRKLGRGLSGLVGEAVRVNPGVGQAGLVGQSGISGQNRQVGGGGAGSAISGEGGGGGGVSGSSGSSGGGVLADGRRLVMVDVGDLVAGPFQPRRVFEGEALAELAASIRTAGVMQPLVVRVRRGGSVAAGKTQYEIIAGERRLRAAILAEVKAVPCVVTDVSDQQAATWALIENVQRTDLGVVERAFAYVRLRDKFAMTQDQIAAELGVSRPSVSHYLTIAKFDSEILDLLEQGALTFGHAKILMSFPRMSVDRKVEMAKRAAEGAWSVSRLSDEFDKIEQAEFEAEQLAENGGSGVSAGAHGMEAASKELDRKVGKADMRALEEKIGHQLGTRVLISARKRGGRGRMSIEFYSLDHFDALMGKLGVKV